MLKETTFRGGVHPPDSKSATREKPTRTLKLPSKVVLPLSQHIGAPLEVCVAVGSEVKVGTVIAKPTGFVSIPLHSTISGRVKAIGEALHPTGVRLPAVEIEGDGEDKWEEPATDGKKYSDLTPDELKECIRNAGIVGLGGAAFPTHVKLSPPPGKPIDMFIVNGAECEPYLTSDFRQMLERSKDLIVGIKIVQRILGSEKVLIAVERNKPEAIEVMDRLCREALNYEVVPLKTKYPQGGEKQLIQALTGRQVPSGGLPMDVGCMVHNVSTLLAIYDAVTAGKPLVEKVVTLAGEACANPGNYKVRVGALVEDILKEVEGGIPETLGKIIMGGPMMGIALPSLNVPILKGTNGLVLLAEPVPLSLHRQCIRCGRCVDSCPIRLLPCELAVFAEHQLWDKCREYSVKDCIECGACGYTCPAKRNLVQLIRFGKYTVMSQDRKKEKK